MVWWREGVAAVSYHNRCEVPVSLIDCLVSNGIRAFHYDESSECAHVSINEVVCYRTERTLMGCAELPLLRGSVHPISVLELTNNEVVGRSRHWPANRPTCGRGGGAARL